MTDPFTTPSTNDEIHSDDIPAALENGWVYLDVRTEQEFNLGHVPGAYNVPFQLGTLAGFVPNPDFVPRVLAVFRKEQGLILGCHSGNRSRRALPALRAVGFSHIFSHAEGWDGSRDAFGRKNPGWSHGERPRETLALPGRSYAELGGEGRNERQELESLNSCTR